MSVRIGTVRSALRHLRHRGAGRLARMRPVTTQDPAPAGLTAAEAARRLAVDGPNELPAQRQRSDLQILLEVLREPMLALLIVGATIYALLGDPLDAVALAVAAALVIALTFVLARRAERALYALRELTAPQATVIREEFPVVATVLLAPGGHRLARQNVLTRDLTAIETLGSVTVLCVDKTGTLTENRMRAAIR